MDQAVAALEREFARRLGLSSAVATGYGRGALLLALEAVGVAGGDVLVPDFICAQVPEAVRRAGAQPVFYRVPCDLRVQAVALRAVLTASARAVVVAHYSGRVQPEIAELEVLCRARCVPLIEDCALALGAGLRGRPAGSFGDISVFSFTKTDWCYGGGLVATRDAGLAERVRALAAAKPYEPRSAFWYGLLRRLDYAANRPRWSLLAELAGQALERASPFKGGNFYDAGLFDAAMPEFAARRARRVCARLQSDKERRHARLRELRERLGSVGDFLRWPEPEDSAAFLPLESRGGLARAWVVAADRAGLTLRLSWPAYQTCAAGQHSDALDWLARQLVILETHPHWTRGELRRIAKTLIRLRCANPADTGGVT